jgi:sporulation protein YlmC with PRC-barrel domain
MKTRMLIVAEVLAIIFAVAAGVSFAQKERGRKDASTGGELRPYEAAKGEKINAFMVTRIIGSRVRNMKGEDLGSIEDIVVDTDSGQILYAIMDFGGFLGIGGKLFPVPWQALAALPSEGIFFLNVSKAQLMNAPAYNRNNLPDMGDMHWGTKVTQFYEASRGERTYNYGYPYGYGYGVGLYPNIAKEDPFAKIFNPESMKKISGEVIKVDYVIPEKGIISQMEIKLIVFVDQKEPVPVYLGPEWYIAGPQGRSPFKSGDKITATGSWITSGTEPFMIATMVTQGNRTFRLRQKDGTPIWSGLKIERKAEE